MRRKVAIAEFDRERALVDMVFAPFEDW
jgi:hypothetical protein